MIKLLEENIGRTLYDINHVKILYDLSSIVKEIKTKINKWDLIKLKNFCTQKKKKKTKKNKKKQNKQKKKTKKKL